MSHHKLFLKQDKFLVTRNLSFKKVVLACMIDYLCSVIVLNMRRGIDTMPASSLSESIIRKYASAESFRRGQDYYSQGVVLSVVRRGKVIEAEVEGSAPRPYTVRCSFDEHGEPHASCNCPYNWGGWCKHIVAACLMILHDEKLIEERPTLETILADLDRDQLQGLLLKLAERDPSLPDVIEGLLVRSPATKGARPAPITAAMVRRQVQAAFQRNGYSDDYPDDEDGEYWDDEGGIWDLVMTDLDEILDSIRTLIEADEGHRALQPLQAFTEEVLSQWQSMEMDYETEALTELLSEIGSVWTEALLSVDLSSEERTFWVKQLDDWMLAIEESDDGEVFEAAQDAAARGWDYPPLQRILQGQGQGQSEQRAWEGEAPPYAYELTTARLAILERRGRLQEYLYLAKAERQLEAYMLMLVRVGRIDEAVEYGLEHLQTADKILVLVKALHEQGAHEQSLQVAEHGLTLQGGRVPLAKWLREEATSAGKQQLALKAAIIVFQEEITLTNYLRVAELAGEQWSQGRELMLEHVREKGIQNSIYTSMQDERIYIFLHEELIDDAIASVGAYTSSVTTEKVVDAAMSTRPEWAISACQGKAETLIQQGSSHYSDAARWLAKARAGYQSRGALVQWRSYLSELMNKHKKKYKLMRELEVLY
jgi:uncharacterized Zn finger protein